MIYVVDAITGSGKSSWAIQDIISKIKKGEKIIYVTPYLSEIERLQTECKKFNIKLEVPNQKRGRGSKSKDLYNLLLQNKNIVTTHACFDRVSKDFLRTLENCGYTLYMDEVHKVVDKYNLTTDDLNMLMNNNYVSIDPISKQVHWIASEYDGRFEDFKNLCSIGSMYYYDKTIYIWTFPASIFNIMKDTYVLTYLFKGQEQCYYYEMNNLEYKMMSIVNETPQARGMFAKYELVDYDIKQYLDDIAVIKPLINIYDGKLNLDYNLSSYFYDNADKESIKKIKKNLYTYFKNNVKETGSDNNMWTTLKSNKEKIKGKGYTKGFIEITARATNIYSHKKNLAYAYDRFMNPLIYNFFHQKGITPREDIYAVSELVQWVFRSAVRKGESINLYLPSKRMRLLFINWLDGKIIQ